MSIQRAIVVLLLLIIGVLYMVKVTMEVSLSTGGMELKRLQDKALTLQQINMDLENHYLEAAAYTTINREARVQGFITAPTITFEGR